MPFTIFITWNPNPEIFRIGSLAVRWYGVLFALGFVFGYLILQRMFRKEGVPLKVLDSVTTYMIIGTLIGARLGHCLFYEPDYYLSHPLRIFAIWEGGLASHGSAIGIVGALIIFSIVKKRPFLWVIDRVVIVVALAGCLIRLGNLMNSEIFGHVTTLPWGFIFTRALNPLEAEDPRHPTQIYEALSYLLIFFYLIWYYYRKNGKPELGFLFGMFLLLIFGIRILIEFVKEPQVGFEATMALNMGQWLSIPFVLAGVYFVVRAKKMVKW
ncbi:MAG: prolipoprotein diacylglyceryl transferase [Bacteroidales bacterium]|nr:prolipoprotein diacylglyceryl transferase [Bacteroidales bacterium]